MAFDLQSIERIIHGAAPCPPDIKRAMIDWLGPILEESYGGTEGNGLTMISSAEWLEHPGVRRDAHSSGRIHIVGEDGEELPPGERGLVYFSGGRASNITANPRRRARRTTRTDAARWATSATSTPTVTCT